MKKFDEKQHPRDADGRFEARNPTQCDIKDNTPKSIRRNNSINRPRNAEGRFIGK